MNSKINSQLLLEKPYISVIIPVYGAEKTINLLYHRLLNTLKSITLSYEIIFVDDCSKDNSWLQIKLLADSDPCVHGISLNRNFGQHAATICGMAFAHGDWVATLDDDLEQAPEDLLILHAKAQEGYDLVYGVFERRTHENWRNFTSEISRWLFSKSIPNLNLGYSSYRFIRGDIAREISNFNSPHPFVDGYLTWLTNRYAVVNVKHHLRHYGSSNYTFSKLLTHSINIFATFSDLPLRIASWLGLAFFLIGMGWLGLILVGRLLGWITVSGFASIIAAIVLFGGIQLLILGIFGEYLGRVNFKTSKKPHYYIAKSTVRPRNE